MKARNGEPRAFFEEALSSETDDCILWPYANARGYAKMWVGNRNLAVHRLACECWNGSPPDIKLDAAHNCGNRACINGRHLRWDTRKGNHADKIKHGTTNRGERQGHSKLSSSDVLRIKERLLAGDVQRCIGADFGVSRETVSGISRGRSWGWL